MTYPRAIPAMLLLAFAGCSSSMPPSLGHSLAGGPAPRLAELARSEGAVGLTSAERKVTVIDFWASWCPGCQESIPALDELYRDKRGDGVMVIGVSVDERDEDALAAARDLHATFPIVLDPSQRISGSYRVAQVPITFVVDRNGTVRWVGRDPSAVRQAVNAVLAE